MDPSQVSAQFAAFVWFCNDKPDTQETREQANHFAEANWPRFLPLAHEGLGRLLLKLKRPPRKRRWPHRPEFAAAG